MNMKFIFIRCLVGILFFLGAVFFAGENWLPVLLLSVAGLSLFVSGGMKLRKGILTECKVREEQLYSVPGNCGAAFYMADTQGSLLYCDSNCCSLEKELAGQHSGNELPLLLPYLYDESEFHLVQAKLESCDGVFRLETEQDSHNGERMFLSHCLQEIYDSEGSVCALAGTVCDISALIKTRNALAKEKRYLDAVMNGTEAGLFIHDLDGDFIRVNKSFANFAGAGDPELCKGTNFHNYIAPQVVDRVQQVIQEIVANGNEYSIQIPAINSNGEKLELDIRGCLCCDGKGEPEAIVGFTRRIEEQKEDPDQESVGGDPTLMQVLCHEMRTPLAGMIGSLHVLENMALAPEAKEYVRKCVVSAERFKDVVNSSLSGLAGEFNPDNKESLDPAACFGKAVELFLPAASIQNRSINLSIGGGLPDTVLCSRKGLSQALFCLINNSLEFFPDSDISAGVKMDLTGNSDPVISFYVSGTGHDGTKDNVYVECLEKIAESIGAELYFVPGQTAELGFRLKVEEGRKAAIQETQPVQALRILLAEDDISSQVFMRKKLESWGHTVRTASTGVDVLNYMEDQEYDLVLMDLQMPEMSGFDAIASIRQAESPQARIPIIVMSAYGQGSDFERMSELGVDDYIAKPVSTEMLKKSMQRLAALGKL